MAIFQKKPLNWFITGNDLLNQPWQFATAGNLGRVNHHWTITSLPKGGTQAVGFVDMGLDSPTALAYNKDRLTLTYDVRKDTTYTLSMKGVEYVNAPLDKDISLVSVGPTGFTTDGSLVRIKTGVGNQTLAYESAARDSVVFMGAGRDAVQLDDNPFTEGTQYWALIRRGLGQVDAYNLQTGNFVRMEGGTSTWGNTNRYINYGEIEEIYATHARSGGRYKFDPGRDIPKDPWGINNRSLFDNIDLASDDLKNNATNAAVPDGQVDPYSDSFNLAYFNFIRYTTNNLYVGQATVHSGNNVSGAYSTPGSQNRNGTHDLVVAEQSSAIDGELRLYVRNVQSGLYNEFNAVFLGSAADDGKNYSGVTGTTPASRVALYGFGGEDVLKGGAGNDYLFGGSSSYSQLVEGATGNQVTGGAGADYFGVGNTDSRGVLTGVGTDVIFDWDAGTDSLRVLSNGTAIIGGLYGKTNLNGHDFFDLRAYAAKATSDADNDGSVLNAANDLTVINDGLIVALGRDGFDTLRDSPGDDRLYGNAQDNLIDLSAGGSDRVLYDAYSGRQFVRGFDSNDASLGHDLFMVNSRVVDSFGSHRTLAMEARNSFGNYTNVVAYDPGVNYLHDKFYNPRLAAPNAVHTTEDGSIPIQGADGTSFAIGVGIAIAAELLSVIPFVGPVLRLAGLASAALLGAGAFGAPIPGFTTTPHQNATYDGEVNSYLTVLNNPTWLDTSSASESNLNVDAPAFLSFFGFTDARDGYVPVLEFTRYSSLSGLDRGITGYFAVHSDDETLVYLVTSRDALVDNSEAKLVAEINGTLWADDFQVYDGKFDIYNAREETPITLSLPTIDSVTKGGDTVDSGSTTTLSSPFTVNVSVDAAVSAGSKARLYDGTTLVASDISVSGTSFSLTDARELGTRVTVAGGTADLLADNTLQLTDDRVNYTVELIDGVTGIVTRNENDYFFTASGGNALIDGGDGNDNLMLTETSAFLNSRPDDRLVNIETITLAESGLNLSLSLQTEGFTVYGTGPYEQDEPNPLTRSGLDTITGSQGNDVIYGLGGSDTLNGEGGNDTFVVSSSTELAGVFSIDGGSGKADSIRLSAADTAIDDSDFLNVLGVEQLELTGASTITSLGVEAVQAGIQKVITGAGNTSITATMTALTVDAAAMVDNETQTLAGSTNFTVTGLNADVSAPTASGNLSLSYASTNDLVAQVTAGTENLTVIGGHSSQSITIEADAMDDNQSGTIGQSVLTLDGSGAIAVNDFGSNLVLQSTASLSSLAVDVREVNTGSLVFSLGTGSVGGNVAIDLRDLDSADQATVTGGSGIVGSLTVTTDGADVFAGGAVKGLTINGSLATTDVVMQGGSGNDTIYAGSGSNTIVSGQGADTIDLRAGDSTQDLIVYDFSDGGGNAANKMANDAPAAGANSGYDVISNFDFGSSDKIDVTTFYAFDRILDGDHVTSSLVLDVAQNTVIGNQGMLVATGSGSSIDLSFSGGETLTGDIAGVLGSYFDMTSLNNGEDIFFAVGAADIDGNVNTAQYWFGVYRNSWFDPADLSGSSVDDIVYAGDIQVIALVGSAPGGDGVFDGDNLTVGFTPA